MKVSRLRRAATVRRLLASLALLCTLGHTAPASARTQRAAAFGAESMATPEQSASVPGVGVSRALATERARRVSALHYDLRFVLMAHADTLAGTEILHFALTADGAQHDLPIDFRDGLLQSASLNGNAVLPHIAEGHLLLPASSLRAGENVVEFHFTARVATAGAAVTRYEDKDDGSEYLYSLFVPMDASMAFPCFDQPDLKAQFTLAVEAPAEWTVVGNTAPSRNPAARGRVTTSFAETKPISTYLFAFAAGPWARVHPVAGQPDVYVRRSQVARAEPEVPQLQQITARGMAWLTNYFHQPFPFPKYDLVLIPGFPFGGMEHAGATFLREDGVLFRTAPTAADRFQRNILTLHELTHQWFGDLATMRWFDDLWLKEGFAQYMAYRCLDALEPDAGAWKHFYEDIKPQAYGIDETLGTTPIFQDIPNLKDAKSAYGAIVYQKAPAILKQLEFRLGPEAFRDGLRLYLAKHAYGNAEWSDLIDALHAASGQDVRTWADAWVLRRGMPEVTADWSCKQGTLSALTLHQQDVLPDNFTWPMTTELLLQYPSRARAPLVLKVDFSERDKTISIPAGTACPNYVFANHGDHAYGRFLLDAKSEQFIQQQLRSEAMRPDSTDPLLSSMLWGALWDNVHVARSAPRGYVDLVLSNLPHEEDETLARIQGGRATFALEHYMSAAARAKYVPPLEKIVTTRLQHADSTGLRIVSFRTLTGVAESDAGRQTLKDLLAGKLTVPGVELRQLDRWNLVGRLVALNDPDANAIYATERKRDSSGEGEKYAWAAAAGRPDPAVKAQYFAEYIRSPKDAAAKSEDWLTQSLRPFNSWNQAELTEPYLRRALDQLPEIKRDRRIFFLGAWLGAFLGGQNSPQALAVVDGWLAQPGIDPDLRRKVLENVDELERTVRIRQRFPE